MNKSVVGVLVPVYNAAGYIDRCIKSILMQTYHDIKLFIVDDGSSDMSYEICYGYAQIDSRIVLVRQDNKGACYTRQRLVDMARNDDSIRFIAFIDADDFVHSTYISRLVEVQGGGYNYCLGWKYLCTL